MYLCEVWPSLCPCFHHPLHNQALSNETGAVACAKFHEPADTALASAQEPARKYHRSVEFEAGVNSGGG